MRDGVDIIATRFTDSSLTQPPGVRLTEPNGCAAQQGSLVSENRSGYMRLTLSCRGLKRGSTARVRIVKPVRRSFRLHGGSASVEVQLAKPPGSVQPLASLGYGQADKSCRSLHDRLRMHSRAFDLRVEAHCGRAAGNAMAHLYVGGLLG